MSSWGIHHLDIAQWGNGADGTAPSTIEGQGEFPGQGVFDAILRWRVRFEYSHATRMTFVSDGALGFQHGIRFIGEEGWVHVKRGVIEVSKEQLLRDPQNKYGSMPIKLPVSNRHTYNFVDAVKNGVRAICDIEAAVRSDTLCRLALIAVKQGRTLRWDPQAEQFPGDDAANSLLRQRPSRGDWRLPEV